MIADRKRFAASDYVEVTVHFRCNLKCLPCMIEGTMDWLRPETDDQLDKILVQNAGERRWRGLTLTGSEVTLRPDLPDLARRARRHGFEHVRIQTHGIRLADKAYARELVEAGIDEYFVSFSVTAADAATHDSITGVAGSFGRTLRGLETLDEFDVTSLTNTVVTQRSYA
jgi:MoaA/NifB/PqqE/SkfB family radical SAM enzyme